MSLRSRFAKSRRLCVEPLEARENPSNFTVTVSGPNMTIVGDADENELVINGVVGAPTQFKLSSSVDKFNGKAGPFETPAGIENITIKTFGGADTVIFSDIVVPIKLAGSLSIDGGDDANAVNLTKLTVGKALNITNGGVGSDYVALSNLIVSGAVTIRNGDGDTNTAISTSRLGNALTVSNGTGADAFSLIDTNVGGNVTINNGKARADGVAGNTHIANEYNSTTRSVIKGNVSVTYRDGNQSAGYADGIFDTEITGNVTFIHGTGNFATTLDGYRTTLPVSIGGNLTLKGTGVNGIHLGTLYQKTGLVVGGNFTSTSGGGDITLNKLEVKGSASFTSHGGAPVITGTVLVVGRNLSIGRNTNADTTLTNLNVGGSLTIKSKTGGATTIINRTDAGWNFIGGAVSIANHDGMDSYDISDTNFGSHLTVNSGAGDMLGAGFFVLSNFQNTTRSKIGGNVVVSFLSGNGNSGIHDAEVNGNVTFNNGSGAFETFFTGFKSGLPTLVHGGVSITGIGKCTLSIGHYSTHQGLIVDKTFKLTTGAFSDVVNLRDLHVGGVATMNLGDGANTVAIDDSTFCNKLTMLTGSGVDQIKLDTLTNTTRETTFKGAVLIRTGAGNDRLTRAGTTDNNQALSVWNKFVFDGGAGDDVTTSEPLHEFYPFGNSIQEV